MTKAVILYLIMNNDLTDSAIKSRVLYIHVPFCASRCIYCDFFSSTAHKELEAAYIDALCRELIMRANEACVLETIYFGGGTPSLLSSVSFSRIFETLHSHYTLSKDVEITMECNPDDVTAYFVKTLQSLAVNRVSIGVQTFDDIQLRFLKRRHNASQAKKAITLVADTLTDNVSIDLIYALPNQGITDWRNNLEEAFKLPITHLSAYALSYEKNTVLWRMRELGKVVEIVDESAEEMYNLLIKYANNYGFEHYEISNFSRPNYRSQHNSTYWKSVPYIGCGPGAHSYDGKRTRRMNKENLPIYISMKNFFEEEHLSDADLYNELLFTRLRTMDGLDIHDIPLAFADYFQKQVCSHLHKGSLIKKDNRIRLSNAAIFLSDSIISDLMWID